MDDFNTNLILSNKEHRPLFVYVQEMDMNSLNILKKMLTCKEFIINVNKFYRCFGFITNA